MERYYRLLYPMRVVLITSKYNGKENVMSAVWCFPLSMTPPYFGVCVSKERYSYGIIRKGGKFAINLPGAKLKDAIIFCGRNSGRDIDKFKEAGLTREYGKLGLPLIKECYLSIECTLVSEYEIGDHVLFVGKLENIIKRREEKGVYQVKSNEFIMV